MDRATIACERPVSKEGPPRSRDGPSPQEALAKRGKSVRGTLIAKGFRGYFTDSDNKSLFVDERPIARLAAAGSAWGLPLDPFCHGFVFSCHLPQRRNVTFVGQFRSRAKAFCRQCAQVSSVCSNVRRAQSLGDAKARGYRYDY